MGSNLFVYCLRGDTLTDPERASRPWIFRNSPLGAMLDEQRAASAA